jgi:2-amino-4-hydroxy-6-hydroxymethyldihydropteridine diphosphokinase
MPLACLALGSNLGDRRANLDAAVLRLRAEPGLRVLHVSNFYNTTPVDCPFGAGDFLNAAAVVETSCLPDELLKFLHEVEYQFGRERGAVNAPRTLDLDLLLYGERVMQTRDLTLPHPRMHERAFVLVPLAEIAPQSVHPILRRTVNELLASLPDIEKETVKRSPPPAPSSGVLLGMKALVTGSSGGIGRAIALAFARAGAEVTVHGRSKERIEETAAACRELSRNFGLPVHGKQADLSDQTALDQLVGETWSVSSGLDVVVCNAGADVLTGEASKWSFEEKLEELLAVDLKATMRLSRGMGERMKAQGRGCILTVAWDQAETGMEGDSGQLFAAVKGAIACFTRSLAKSLAPAVRVNCLAPGWIRTAWGETASEVWQERVRRETPLKVWGLPEDVAAAALWLSSPSARFITGQTIKVNGGVN